MTKEKIIQEIREDKKRLTEAMALFDEALEKLENGTTAEEIERTLGKAEELIEKVYFGE